MNNTLEKIKKIQGSDADELNKYISSCEVLLGDLNNFYSSSLNCYIDALKDKLMTIGQILSALDGLELSMTILRGIVNPDSFTGEKGGRALITRVFTALVMLVILMPIPIPSPKNEYEIQLNNNGVLFGTLYSLQYRILNNNTIADLHLIYSNY